MWIMLNNKPFDLSKMTNVSGVIEVTAHFLKKSSEDKRNLDTYSLLSAEERNEMYNSLRDNTNKVFGYCFIISVSVDTQRYLNGSSNGISRDIKEISSSLYKTKEDAQTALEHFLFETNGILNGLPKINI